MRAVVQRVDEASVSVGGTIAGQVDQGFLVLIGVKTDDAAADATYIADKIVNLRIFEDEEGKMNRSLLDVGGAALIVSQFTLYGDARKGRRPGFVEAASGETAKALYDQVCEQVKSHGVSVQKGQFGSEMKVRLVNDGPVTILLDSRKEF